MKGLGSLALLSRRDRGAAVEATACQLAATFQDGHHLRFWCWLVWQLIRGVDQGQDWTEDVAHILARIWHDARDGSGRKPAAPVVAALDAACLLDVLRNLPPTRVGVKPESKAA